MRIALLLALGICALWVAQIALFPGNISPSQDHASPSTDNVALWPVVGLLASAAVGLGINVFNRWDSQGDRRRSRAEIITLLSAEMHNFTRQHATNLTKLSQLLREKKNKRDVIEALERFSFRGRPGSHDEELFKVTSVEQLAHLPRFLSRDFMRVHIIARNLERDIERSLARVKRNAENADFQAFVTEELYRLGDRLERATQQGQLLLDRLDSYENRNLITRSFRKHTRRFYQSPLPSQFIYTDRPMQPDDTRAYEELSRWRELVKERSNVADKNVLEVAALASNTTLESIEASAVISGRHEGTFNQIFVVKVGDSRIAVRRRMNKDLFRYDQTIVKEAFVGKLFSLTEAKQEVSPAVVQDAMMFSRIRESDFFERDALDKYPGPKVLGFGVHEGHQYAVSEWLEGQSGGAFSTPRNYYELGCSVATMHSRTFSRATSSLGNDGLEVRTYLEAIKKEIADRNESSGMIVERSQLNDWLAARMMLNHRSFERNYPFVICHNDLHPFNIFLTRAGIRIIDWDNAVVAHPYLDFVKPKYWSNVVEGKLAGSSANFNKFVEGYSKVLEGERRRLPQMMNDDPIFQLHEMLWLFRIWTFETGRQSKGNRDLVPFQEPKYYEPLIWRLAKKKLAATL